MEREKREPKKAQLVKSAPELERKFLIWEEGQYFAENELNKLFPSFSSIREYIEAEGKLILQGYLRVHPDFNHELRLRHYGNQSFFTIKYPISIGKFEIEFGIPNCVFIKNWHKTKGKQLRKIRCIKEISDFKVEIDFFLDKNLITAEIETKSQEELEKIPILGKEITHDKNYSNYYLASKGDKNGR